MEKRSDQFITELQKIFTGQVYFQPPSNVVLKYPCIVVHREGAYQPKANDMNYLYQPSYKVIYVNQDEPDPEIVQDILNAFPITRYTGHGVVDNLHHDYFTIYY